MSPKFQVLLIFVVVCLISTTSGLLIQCRTCHFLIAAPYRRRMHIPQCYLSAHNECIGSTLADEEALLEKMRNTDDLREICRATNDALACLSLKVRDDCSAEDKQTLGKVGLTSYWGQIVQTLWSACDHVDAFNQHKSCLLRTDGGSLTLGVQTELCVRSLPEISAEDRARFCYIPRILGCLSSAATEQCGSEIGGIIGQIKEDVQHTCSLMPSIEHPQQQKRNLLQEILQESLWQ